MINEPIKQIPASPDRQAIPRFNTYTRSDGKRKTIKNGWSWPAFFFSWAWAFYTQLWSIGFLLLIASAFFTISFSILGEYQHATSGSKNIGGFLAIVWVAIRIKLGAYGNEWKRNQLEKNGFKKNSETEIISPVSSTPSSESLSESFSYQAGRKFRRTVESAAHAAGVAYTKSRAKSDLEERGAKYDALAKLKALHESGVISDSEFEAEKSEILGR